MIYFSESQWYGIGFLAKILNYFGLLVSLIANKLAKNPRNSGPRQKTKIFRDFARSSKQNQNTKHWAESFIYAKRTQL